MIIPLLHKLLNVTLKLSADDDICTKELILKKLLVATYLDPRCKSLPFLSDAEKNFVVEILKIWKVIYQLKVFMKNWNQVTTIL